MAQSSLFKRIIAALLLVCMVLSFSACDDNDKEQGKEHNTSHKETKIQDTRIPYSREDGLNPFMAKSLMNNSVMPLIYDGLFFVDSNFNAQPSLAADFEVVDNTIIVNLASKRFSDGSVVSADDVIYSFNKAKASPYYASQLIQVNRAYAKSDRAIVFDFPIKNIYSAACLTFPVVKQGTAEDIKSIPTGSGQYKYKETPDGGRLLQNRRNTSEEYNSKNITLVNMSTSTALMYALVVNNYDATYDDLSDGSTERINASTIQVQLNNMIYLGINSSGIFADPVLRHHLNNCINREVLVNSGLEGNASPTRHPFNPSWYALKEKKYSFKASKESEDYLATALKGKTLNILTNADNSFKKKLAETLVSELNSLHVSANVVALPADQYIASAQSGAYDLLVGEIKLTNDMNISSLIGDEELINSYAEMMAGNIKPEEFAKLFDNFSPFIPIGFRKGILAYSRNINSEVRPLPESPYANIKDWVV